MLPSSVTRTWLRNKRRILNLPAGRARRRLRGVRNKFYADLWQDAADKIGATTQRQPNGLLQISMGSQATFVDHSDLMLDSALTLRLMANKALTYDLMSKKSVRLPAYCRFTLATLADAERFLERQNGPVVIKPADGTGGGRGVITGITERDDLNSAARHAAGFNTTLLAEEQLTGASFRLLYLDGEFLDAVRRDSPTVTGDGTSSISRLVKAENARREDSKNITALSPLILDHEARNTLASQSRSPSDVPTDGETVQVKLAVNENGSAQNHVVRKAVHPEIIETGARLVREFGIKFAGLDVTADDISAPLAEGDIIFNEINVNPGIHHHYLVSNRDEQTDIAPALLERMFGSRMGTIDL